jgi:Zn finger protein HypA/HybF involved in hydrogenase expression
VATATRLRNKRVSFALILLKTATPTEAAMTQLEKRPRCSACDHDMELAVVVPPFEGQYGLKAFSCPKCGRSESVFVAPLRTRIAR